MTQLQKTQFEILKEFVRVCEQLDLTYYLVCGSCLGAVKYHGFIPWDDDIDVALPRKDYDTFCKNAPALLSKDTFLQNYRTDVAFSQIYSKLRNSKTTYIETSSSKLPINHGVYIDVFPLDGHPSKKWNQWLLKWKKRTIKLMIGCSYETLEHEKGLVKIIYKLERCLGFHKRANRFVKRLDRILSVWPAENSSVWCNHGNWQGELEYAAKKQYGDGAWCTFEGLRVRIPEKYDEYLTQKYGDWRADLPDEQKIGHHYAEVIDLTRPYTDYIEHLPNGKIRIKGPEELNNHI